MSKSRLTVFSFVRRFLLRLMVVLAIFWGGGIAL
ncbi:peptidoglycan transglycosylase, partial [Escherichia coli]